MHLMRLVTNLKVVVPGKRRDFRVSMQQADDGGDVGCDDVRRNSASMM
jgi:hypothetical protein